MFYNRLFFNMTNCMDYVSRILLTQKENVLVSLSAHDVPELIVPPLAPWPVRLINFIRQSYAITFAGRHVGKLTRLEQQFRIELTGDLDRDHSLLTEAISSLAVAFNHHNMASARSGMIYAVIMGILTGNKRKPTHEDHYLGTLLLSDIPGIESADAVKSLEKFAEEIISDDSFSNDFTATDTQGALALITEMGPEKYRILYQDFLRRHGHRCIRESELREKPWEEDPIQLVSMLQSRVTAGRLHKQQNHVDLRIKALLAKLTPVQRFFIKLLHGPARKAVAGRELNKANSMRMLHRIRMAYRQFSENLVTQGLLEDSDQIYFLTHPEIGELINDRDPKWKQKANKRRILLPETAKLTFDLMNAGIPEPVEENEMPEIPEGALKGIPVSSGVARGKARVVNTLEEAVMLEKGEIMVVSYTDIGWTPYFSIIGGLVTEIGSPLSHGAVVAREYGIPAVVSVKGALRAIKTGDFVLLNGNKGTVETFGNEQ
jgi:pyruvate,water dikinase